MPDDSNLISCDVVVQAGHQNTPDGRTGGEGPLGREIDWTPVVADTAVALLRAAGVQAVKEDASIKASNRTYDCKLAVFVHFDAPDSGESGPSVGYPDGSANAEAAAAWKTLYARYWPFPATWRPDNFTADEHGYYCFHRVTASEGQFLIEVGDLASLRQAQWMQPRLEWIGKLLAYFLSDYLGVDTAPLPAPFGEAADADDNSGGGVMSFPAAPVFNSSLLAGNPVMDAIVEGHMVLHASGLQVEGTGLIQDALNLLSGDHPAYAIDLGDDGKFRGFFGEKTESAVEAFQRDAGLDPDGRVGRDTLLALDAALAGLPVVPTPAAFAATVEHAVAAVIQPAINILVQPAVAITVQPAAAAAVTVEKAIPVVHVQFVPPPASAAILGGIRFELADAQPGAMYKQKFDAFDQSPKGQSDPSKCKALLLFDDGTVFFSSKLAIDADGSPRATTIDSPQNASTDTSAHYPHTQTPFNAETVPYIVLPMTLHGVPNNFMPDLGLGLGDVAAVIYKGQMTGAIVADEGPTSKIGEGSIRLHEMLPMPSPWRTPQKNRIIDDSVEEDVLTFVFPGTAASIAGQLTPATAEAVINARASELFLAFQQQQQALA